MVLGSASDCMMEYHNDMDFAEAWKRFKNWSFRMAAPFAEIAVGVPGIIIAYENEVENRVWILFLTVFFLVTSFIFANLSEGHRHKRITPYLVLQTSLTSALLVLAPYLSFYAIWFYVLAVEAIVGVERRIAMRWLLLFTILTVGILGALLPVMEALISVPVFLGGFFFFVTFANATYDANEARKESQRLLAELKITNRRLQEYALKAEQLAVAEERNRLAREMHDTIGHRLTVASVQLEGLRKVISKEPDKAGIMAGTIREQVREALQDLRSTVATLREPLEADLPLDFSLKRLVHSFEEATGLKIELLLPEIMPELPNGHRLAIYRTAQEALTNVQKHADATRVWLQFEPQQDTAILRVSDNGKGMIASEDGGFGLRGIQERAVQLNGELILEERRGGGTQLSLCLPVKSAS